MEDALYAVAVGIEEYVLIQFHGFLLVAAEEVYLDAPDADALQPCHLAVAGYAGAQTVARCLRRVVLKAVAVVPEHQRDTLCLGVLREFHDAVAPDVLVPPIVY